MDQAVSLVKKGELQLQNSKNCKSQVSLYCKVCIRHWTYHSE
jgi:hypothetical protein